MTVENSSRSPVVILYDDRPTGLTGVKLAALSLTATSPSIDLRIMLPRVPETFRAWAGKRSMTVIEPSRPLRESGWDAKPSVLLDVLLSGGVDQVVWVDTDIIATSDLLALLSQHREDAIVAAEEYYWGPHQGSDVRTTALGLEVGRVFPRSINSGVLRVSHDHRELLENWVRVLRTPAYVAAQLTPISRRPVAYLGDQEVLSGLLGSTKYGHLPVSQLRRGVDIAQAFGPSGYTVLERWRSRHKVPPLIHAMGRKPWTRPTAEGGLARRTASAWENAHLDLTPYVFAAQPYISEVDEPTEWVGPHTVAGKLLTHLGSPILQELPLALIDTSQRALRRKLRIRQVPHG